MGLVALASLVVLADSNRGRRERAGRIAAARGHRRPMNGAGGRPDSAQG